MRLFAMLLVKDTVIMSLCIAESATTLIAGQVILKAFGNCVCISGVALKLKMHPCDTLWHAASQSVSWLVECTCFTSELC